MNKKAIITIAVVALVAGGGLWVYSTHSSPVSSSSASVSEPSSTPQSDSSNDPIIEESGFTQAINQYLSENSITEKITGDVGLQNLYNYLKDDRHIDPTVLQGEDNEYFPGYLEWYKAEGWKVDLGPQTDPAPAPTTVPAGEVGKQPDGSIKFEDGRVFEASRVNGVFVPIDQVLTYVQTNYGTEALGVITELINMEKVSVRGIQSDLALDSADEFKNFEIPGYKDSLEAFKQEEIDVYNAQHNYDPNKSVYSNNG